MQCHSILRTNIISNAPCNVKYVIFSFSADEDPKCYQFTWSSDKENPGESNSTNVCGVSGNFSNKLNKINL